MPRKRQSDDADHVPIDPKSSKPSKDPPPPQWPLPDFAPLAIENKLTYGISPDDPYSIFSLFFDDHTLSILVENTKQYAEWYPAPIVR